MNLIKIIWYKICISFTKLQIAYIKGRNSALKDINMSLRKKLDD